MNRFLALLALAHLPLTFASAGNTSISAIHRYEQKQDTDTLLVTVENDGGQTAESVVLRFVRRTGEPIEGIGISTNRFDLPPGKSLDVTVRAHRFPMDWVLEIKGRNTNQHIRSARMR